MQVNFVIEISLTVMIKKLKFNKFKLNFVPLIKFCDEHATPTNPHNYMLPLINCKEGWYFSSLSSLNIDFSFSTWLGFFQPLEQQNSNTYLGPNVFIYINFNLGVKSSLVYNCKFNSEAR